MCVRRGECVFEGMSVCKCMYITGGLIKNRNEQKENQEEKETDKDKSYNVNLAKNLKVRKFILWFSNERNLTHNYLQDQKTTTCYTTRRWVRSKW